MVDRRRAITIILIEAVSLAIIGLIIYVLWASAAPAAAPLRLPYQVVPSTMSYQGRIDVSGNSFNGVGQFKFAIINASGTTAYWTNDGTGLDTAPFTPTAFITLTVNDGLFSVYLGDTAIPGMVAITRNVFTPTYNSMLRVWFNDGTHDWQMLAPDTKFSSSPYAFVSSWSLDALSANTAITANWATAAGEATTALTATWATTTANVLTATWATTSTFATTALTSTWATTSTMAESAVWALNAILANNAFSSIVATTSVTSTWATTASYALAAPGGGTITQVVAGTGLNGGGTSGAVTVTLNTSVTLTALNADTITSTAGLNVGTAGAASSGNLRYSGNLQPGRNSTYYTGYVFVPLGSALMNSGYDGDAVAASSWLTLTSLFNVPAGVKAIAALVTARDETVGVAFCLGPDSSNYMAVCGYTQVASVYANGSGVVPCDANGNVYLYLGSEVDNIYVRIWGYFI
jgi:hypothetical protein